MKRKLPQKSAKTLRQDKVASECQQFRWLKNRLSEMDFGEDARDRCPYCLKRYCDSLHLIAENGIMAKAKEVIERFAIDEYNRLAIGTLHGLREAISALDKEYAHCPISDLTLEQEEAVRCFEQKYRNKLANVKPGFDQRRKIKSARDALKGLDDALDIFTGKKPMELTQRSVSVLKRIIKADPSTEQCQTLTGAIHEYESALKESLKLKRLNTLEVNRKVLPASIVEYVLSIRDIFERTRKRDDDDAVTIAFILSCLFPVLLGFRANCWNLVDMSSTVYCENGMPLDVDSSVKTLLEDGSTLVFRDTTGQLKSRKESLFIYFSLDKIP